MPLPTQSPIWANPTRSTGSSLGSSNTCINLKSRPDEAWRSGPAQFGRKQGEPVRELVLIGATIGAVAAIFGGTIGGWAQGASFTGIPLAVSPGLADSKTNEPTDFRLARSALRGGPAGSRGSIGTSRVTFLPQHIAQQYLPRLETAECGHERSSWGASL